MSRSISDYRIVDHGMEFSDYFQGHGVSLTPYEHTYTGIGSNFREAIADALECMAQGTECREVDLDAFEARMLGDDGIDEWPDKPAVDHDADDLYYRVSIDFNVTESTTNE